MKRRKSDQSRGQENKRVTVNDRMQKVYCYELSAPVGRNFDPEFKPELTPQQMLALGVFCGKYMTDTQKEFPESWFKRAKLSHHPAAIVRSTILVLMPAGRSQSGETKDGSTRTIRAAGSNGIAVTTWAAACRRRTSARSNAGRLSGATSHKCE